MACSVIATTEKTVTTKRKACTVFANYFVCVITKKMQVIWYKIAKKSSNSVCLQLFCVRDCNQKLFVVAPWMESVWLKLLGYLVIYDCKSD
jgi:hypothetical protein